MGVQPPASGAPQGGGPLAQTWALVLAAGLSSRMGSHKPLLPLGGKTVLGQVLAMFRRAGVGGCLVVLGHRAEDLRPVVLAEGGIPVVNQRYAEGMFTSVQAGAAALPEDCRAFFVLPADMPLIQPSTLVALAQALAAGDRLAVAPTHGGRRGHPPLLSRALAASILTWERPGGLRALLAELGEGVGLAPLDDPGIHHDMDHPEQYQAALGLWARRQDDNGL